MNDAIETFSSNREKNDFGPIIVDVVKGNYFIIAYIKLKKWCL